MYDPARDIFTSSEDAPGDQNDHDATERRSSHASVGKQEQLDHHDRDAAGQPDEHGVSEVGVKPDHCLTTTNMVEVVTPKPTTP